VKPAALTDEEWALQLLINESAHACAYCKEDIHSVEELKLLQVVYVDCVNNETAFYTIDNGWGEYEYKPQLFHFMCWEEIQEELVDILDGQESLFDPDGPCVCTCNGCAVSINPWEIVGIISFGELRRSKRTPNGESTFYFDDCNSVPDVLCSSCLAATNHEVLEMWTEAVA
jgi:hypothetical protein